jgi:ATP synthase F1 delta subunit
MYEFLDRRYALALYDACSEKGNIEQVMEEFEAIVHEMMNNEGLMKITSHPQISKAAKKRIFTEIFQDQITEGMLSFLLLLIEKERILYLKEKYNQFKLIHLERTNTLLAVVKTVIPLEETQKQTLQENLEKTYKKKVIIQEEVDKSILGGLIVRIGSDVIDGSVKNKLKEMKDLVENNQRSRYNFNELNKELIAEVITATPLSQEQLERLRVNLGNFYSHNIVIKQVLDAGIIGEVRVIIGNDIIEGEFLQELTNKDNAIKKEQMGKGQQEVFRGRSNFNKILNAEVKTVVPLTEEQSIRLKKCLEDFYGRRIVITQKIDKDLIGGVYVRIGDDITDGTVKGRLKTLRRTMS